MMAQTTSGEKARVAALNDAFRHAPCGADGRVVCTRGVAALPATDVLRLVQAVATFDAFTRDNDPHGEHDRATVTLDGEPFVWKIDYYADAGCNAGAPDRTACYRVLTIMRAAEY